MKDVFCTKAADSFFELFSDLLESLELTFPHSPVMHALVQEYRDLVRDADQKQFLHTCAGMLQRPLVPGCVKYARAVEAITGSPVTVMHALHYRDLKAVCESCTANFGDAVPLLADMSNDDTNIFWQYVNELCAKCLQYARVPAPKIPTTGEIAQNIQARRSARQAPAKQAASAPVTTGGHAGTLAGLGDLWAELCRLRGTVPAPTFTPERQARLQKMECKTTDAFRDEFPELGAHAYDAASEGAVERIHSLVAMCNGIPPNMMSGIESMAASIVQDINEGRTNLANLDMESIGQTVLSNVSDQDMAAFTKNIDTILPALHKMHSSSASDGASK